MKQPHIPLKKSEIQFMFILALLTSIIAINSIKVILNLIPLSFFQEPVFGNKQPHLQTFIVFCLFIIPIVIENVLLFCEAIEIKNKVPCWYQIVNRFFFGISIILIIFYFSSISYSSILLVGMDRIGNLELFDNFIYGLLMWIVIGLILLLINRYIGMDNVWDLAQDEIYLSYSM